MRRFAFGLLLTATCCLTTAAFAQAPKVDASKFVVFIHAGSNVKDKSIKQIAGALFSKGYVVRSPDNDQDEAGGAGVDYFDDSAKDAAQDVATTVNEAFTRLKLDQKKALSPRRQKTKSPPNYLGVWLF